MGSKKDTVQITSRAPSDVIRILDELCVMFAIERSEFLVNDFICEFDKLTSSEVYNLSCDEFSEIGEELLNSFCIAYFCSVASHLCSALLKSVEEFYNHIEVNKDD